MYIIQQNYILKLHFFDFTTYFTMGALHFGGSERRTYYLHISTTTIFDSEQWLILCLRYYLPTPKSQDWAYFAWQFANYLLIVKADEGQKLPLLLNCLGGDGTDIFDGLADPKSTYADILEQFQKHFDCRTSVLIKRKAFFEAGQTSAESATNFVCCLRHLAIDYNFGMNQADLLHDIFVCGDYNNCLGE